MTIRYEDMLDPPEQSRRRCTELSEDETGDASRGNRQNDLVQKTVAHGAY